MKRNRSLGWRIAWALTALISLAVALAAVVSYEIYHQMRERMIDDFIETESERLIRKLPEVGAHWQDAFERDMGPSMFAWGESPGLPAVGMPAELRALEPGIHYLPKGRSVWHVSVAEVMDGRLYVVYDSIVVEEQSRLFAAALAFIVLVFSVLAFLVSVRISRWLIAPLNVLVERLAGWAPGRAGVAAPDSNEMDRLMDAFNRVLDQVDAAIADQRQFSANLHHEIRTPLTVIRSDAELLLRLQAKHKEGMQARDTSREAERLRRIMSAVDEVKESLESTYSLSIADDGEPEEVRLRSCVQDVGEGLRLEAGQAGLELVNEVLAEQVAHVNRYALLTVMRNIVRNAILHAAPAQLVVRSIDNGLEFTDTGPGIGAQELPYIFERYFGRHRVDGGRENSHASQLRHSGLGLAIAMRVCTLQSWTLHAESPVAQGRGTRFTLVFGRGA